MLVAMLASSLLALVYIGRVVEVAWFREPPADVAPTRAPVSMVAAIWVLVAASVYFGIDATLPARTGRPRCSGAAGGWLTWPASCRSR